jgi:hypothetical protein
MTRYKLPFIFIILVFIINYLHAQIPGLPEEVKVRKIWSNENYNAFTSLIDFNGTFYCAFREGERHVYGRDGITRIISSEDGIKWETAALLAREGYDLRDPKLSITPDGRIMVIIGGSVYNGQELLSRITHVSFSDRTGKNFSDPEPVRISENVSTNNDWLWRVTWHKNTGYGVVYQLGDIWSACLVKTADGINYELVTRLEMDGKPNEATVRVMPDNEMFIMLRREGGNLEGMWGRSTPPYKEWKWKSLGIRLGGPDFISLKNNIIVAGTRIYMNEERYTALFIGDRSGDFRKIVQLPSGGDNSYPGFVSRDKRLWISYYSSHEGSTSIYLAEVPISYIKKMKRNR